MDKTKSINKQTNNSTDDTFLNEDSYFILIPLSVFITVIILSALVNIIKLFIDRNCNILTSNNSQVYLMASRRRGIFFSNPFNSPSQEISFPSSKSESESEKEYLLLNIGYISE